ncbi:MAG: hypothetical protein RR994_03180, partial [Clostridia bacterium]
LPLALETAEIIEYTQRAITLPDTRVHEYIAARLNGYINLDPDAKILKKQLSKTIVSGAACVTLVSECDENIGEEQIIPKGE